VAFEAAGFGVVRAGRVTGFAIRKRWHEDVAGFLAGERAGMAPDARETAVGIVIEARVGHPAFGEAGIRHAGQGGAFHRAQRVALLTRFAPEEFFGVCGALGDPLRRS